MEKCMNENKKTRVDSLERGMKIDLETEKGFRGYLPIPIPIPIPLRRH
jgi:hypothetical protein